MSAVLSVVVPVHNRAGVLQRCLDSIDRQTVGPSEVVLVDDCSTDGSREMIGAWAACGARSFEVRVCRSPTNVGAAAARNLGIQCATSPWVAFLDSDDEWLPEYVGSVLERARTAAESVGVIYHAILVERNGRVRPGRLSRAEGNVRRRLLARDEISPTSAVAAKRSALLSVGGFDEGLRARQDYDLWLRLSLEWDFACVRTPLVVVHYSHDSLTRVVQSWLDAEVIIRERIARDVEALGAWERRGVIAAREYGIGRYLHKEGDERHAIERYLASLRCNPIQWRPWIALGESLMLRRW